MRKIGTLYLHRHMTGLFIVVYHSEKRIGLKSIDDGILRFINKANFDSQYVPLHTWVFMTGISDTWGHIQGVHIALAVLQSQHTIPRVSPHTYILHSQHDTIWASMTHPQYVALATKLPFKALYSYPLPKGEQKYTHEKTLRGIYFT